jgi:2-polyprenyl-3-methyl-5-hydroxy-6-metoxy-1,4-benzoquinol methylase
MAVVLLENGKEVELNRQAIAKITPKGRLAVLFSYDELFWNKDLKQRNAEKLKLLLDLMEEKQVQFLPVPLCSAEQKIVEEFNRKAVNSKPEGFYTEGAYLKPISLYEKIREKGLELIEPCKKCSAYPNKCPGCFEVIFGRNLDLLVNIILNRIKPKDVVVDIGCGQGFYIRNLLERLNNPAQLFLIDPKITLLKELSASLSASSPIVPSLICSIAEHLPFKFKPFNVALLINSFSHFSEPLKAVSEIRRVLKENATIYLIESKELPEGGKAETYEKHNMLTANEIKDVFASEGFEPILAEESEPYYLLVFSRRAKY